MLDITSVMKDYVIEGACALDELDLDEALEGIGSKAKDKFGKVGLVAAKGGSQIRTAAIRLLNAIRALLMKINEHLNNARKIKHELKVNTDQYRAVNSILYECAQAGRKAAQGEDKAEEVYSYLTSDKIETLAKDLASTGQGDTIEIGNSDLIKPMSTGQSILKTCQQAIKGAPDRETLKAINKTVSLVSRAMNVIFGMPMKGSHVARKETSKDNRDENKAKRDAEKAKKKAEADEKKKKAEMERKLKEKNKQK